MQKLILIVLLLITVATSLACTEAKIKNEFNIGISLEELMSNLSGKYEQVDSMEYWPKFTYNTSDSQKFPDTVIRFAPFNYKKRPGILLARIKDGRVARYDIVYDQFGTWKNPLGKLTNPDAHIKHPNNQDNYWAVINRGYSSKNEYNEILLSLKKEYGIPDQIIDSNVRLYSWAKSNLSLRSLNKGTTTIISFYSPQDSPMLESDWQFSNIIPDSTLCNIKLGTEKKVLRNTFNFRDTLIESDDIPHSSSGTIELYSWGIPGKLSFIFDSADKLSRLQWLGVGTGNRSFSATFIFVNLYIHILLKNQIESKAKRNEVVKCRWHDKIDGDTFLTYYNSYNIEFIKCDSGTGDVLIKN